MGFAYGLTGCPCCSGTPSPVICTCTNCPSGSAQTWELVSIAGVTNGSCGSCTSYNGTNIQFLHSTGCQWFPSAAGLCGFGGIPRWQLLITSGPTFTVDSENGGATWVGTAANCLGTVTCTLTTGGTVCSNWPTTIEMRPSGGSVVPRHCTSCCSTYAIPDTLHMTFSSCSGSTCTLLNLTYDSGSGGWIPSPYLTACGTWPGGTILTCAFAEWSFYDGVTSHIATISGCNPASASFLGIQTPDGGSCSGVLSE